MTEIEKEAKVVRDKCRSDNLKLGLNYPYDDLDMAIAFEAGTLWQAKQSPWISIKDRLPEDKRTVLFEAKWKFTGSTYLVGSYAGNGDWQSGDHVLLKDSPIVTVAKWMPIPE